MRALLYVFGTRGGIGQYTAQLANGLGGHVDTHVFCPATAEVDDLYGPGVTVHAYHRPDGPDSTSLRSKVRVLASLKRVTEAVDPDVLHLPFADSLETAPVVALLAARPEPLVGTFHDPIAHGGTSVEVAGIDLHTAANALLARAFDAVIVHGEACVEQAEEANFPMDAVRSIRHGVYEHFLETDHDAPETERTALLFFGQIRPNKGYDRIPDILDRVEERGQEPTAIVAGEVTAGGSAIEETVAALCRDDRVELQDRYVPNEEVGELFSRARVVVLPYWDATSSGVAMTAYAFGTPMVATRVGDIGRTLERDGTGILADPGSNEAIASGIVELIEDDERYEALRRNIREARPEYRFETIAADVVDVYRSLVRASDRRLRAAVR